MDASLTFTVEDLHRTQQFPLILERPRFHLPYSQAFLLHLHIYADQHSYTELVRSPVLLWGPNDSDESLYILQIIFSI